jgi:hypothetical protein
MARRRDDPLAWGMPAMPRAITITKGGETWDIGAIDCAPAILEIAPTLRQWGYTIVEGASAPITISKGEVSMKAKETVKRAVEHGDVDRAALQIAIQKCADKEIEGGATADIRLAKYLERNREARIALDAAPAPAPPVHKTSHAALEYARQEHRRKSALGNGTGERDAVDEHFLSEADRTLRNVAEGLRDAKSGPLKGLALNTIISHLRSSSAYGSAARSGKGYKAVIAAMLKDHLWRTNMRVKVPAYGEVTAKHSPPQNAAFDVVG